MRHSRLSNGLFASFYTCVFGGVGKLMAGYPGGIRLLFKVRGSLAG